MPYLTDNGFTSCVINTLANVSNVGIAVHEMRYARQRMTEGHMQEHYHTAFLTAQGDVARPPLIKSNRPVLTKCPSAGMQHHTAGPQTDTFSTTDDSPECSAMFSCPCVMGKPMCYKMETCDVDTPENVLIKFLHFVRRPLDVVVSSYMYTTQMPPPEEWMTRITMHDFATWMVSVGVPRDRLEALACFATPKTTSYYEHVHGIDPVAGLELEFWRAGYELYDTARQAAWLSETSSAVLTVRVDRLAGHVADLAQSIHDFLKLEVAKGLTKASAVQAVAACERAAEQVPFHKRARLAAEGVAQWPTGERGDTMKMLASKIMGVPHVRKRLCELSEALGYEEQQCGL